MRRSTHYSVLTSILIGETFICHASEIEGISSIVKKEGFANADIYSCICKIKKGDKIKGLLLDDGTWFVMPYDSDWNCCVGVPESSVTWNK